MEEFRKKVGRHGGIHVSTDCVSIGLLVHGILKVGKPCGMLLEQLKRNTNEAK